MYTRLLSIRNNYSFFLFGPRGSGKSTYLKQFVARFPQGHILWLDLLNPEQEEIFQIRPQEILALVEKNPNINRVVIDEVQKAPKLLDLVHSLIEEKKILFALSGSSARKLKRGQANLLAGRAFVKHLYPFSFIELGKVFELQQALEFGLLPKIFQLNDKELKNDFLRAYANTYLKEEVQLEQIVRNLPAFRRFLEVAAQMNGEPLNYSKIGLDIGSNHNLVKSYYEILEDTLLGFHLPAYYKSIRKQQRVAPKFYFFDTGIKRALEKTLEIPLKPKTYEYGKSFEHFFILEVFKLSQYRNKDETLSYLRTKNGLEVDLIISRPGFPELFIECKSTNKIFEQNVSRLKEITAGKKNTRAFLISQDPNEKKYSSIQVLPWYRFFELFWKEEIY